MEEKISDLHTMTSYLQHMRLDKMDDEIAIWLYEHRYELDDYSLTDLAEMGYFSQASISRFLKKNGEKDYATYKMNVSQSLESSKGLDRSMLRQVQGLSIKQTKQYMIERLQESIALLDNLSDDDIEKNVEILSSYQTIYLFGGTSSTQAFSFLVDTLTNHGVNVYMLLDPIGQRNILQRIKENDLVIIISALGEWAQKPSGHTICQTIYQKKCHKMLWTLRPDHPDQEKFDDVFVYGEPYSGSPVVMMLTFSLIIADCYMKTKEGKREENETENH